MAELLMLRGPVTADYGPISSFSLFPPASGSGVFGTILINFCSRWALDVKHDGEGFFTSADRLTIWELFFRVREVC